MKNKLLIIGASGHGKVIADIAMRMNSWKHIAFLDDDENIKVSMGIEVIGKSTDAIKYKQDFDILVGIGNNRTREIIQERLEFEGASIPVLIHPEAVIGTQVELEKGTVVMARAVINCCTRIGKGSIINTGATIDHDNLIEDYVHISPGVHLGGTVRIGKRSWIGIGALVSNNINITNNCIIGANTTILKSLKDPGTYIGTPARRIK